MKIDSPVPVYRKGGGQVERRCWVNFQCRGVLLVWIIGQGPIALAVGAGGGCLDIFSLIYLFSFPSPSLWETTRYRLKYCLKGPLNPKQPTNQKYTVNIINIQTNRIYHRSLMQIEKSQPKGKRMMLETRFRISRHALETDDYYFSTQSLNKVVLSVTHKAVRPGARPHVPPVMAEGDFRLMTPLYDNLQ